MDRALDTFGYELQRDTFLGSGTFENVGKIRDVNGAPNLDRDEEDTTNHDSQDEIEENIPTVGRVGSTSFDLVYDPDNPLHVGSQSLVQDWKNKTFHTWRGVNPTTGTVEFECVGWVKSVGRDYPVKGHQRRSVTIRWAQAPSTVT